MQNIWGCQCIKKWCQCIKKWCQPIKSQNILKEKKKGLVLSYCQPSSAVLVCYDARDTRLSSHQDDQDDRSIPTPAVDTNHMAFQLRAAGTFNDEKLPGRQDTGLQVCAYWKAITKAPLYHASQCCSLKSSENLNWCGATFTSTTYMRHPFPPR